MFIDREIRKKHTTPSGSNIPLTSQIYKHMKPTGSLAESKMNDAGDINDKDLRFIPFALSVFYQ